LGKTPTMSRNSNSTPRSADCPASSRLIGNLERETHLHDLVGRQYSLVTMNKSVSRLWEEGLKVPGLRVRLKDSRRAMLTLIFGEIGRRGIGRYTRHGRRKGNKSRPVSCVHREQRSCSLNRSYQRYSAMICSWTRCARQKSTRRMKS